MEIAICGSMRNFIGKDGSKFRTDWKGDYIPTGVKDNKNKYVENKGIKESISIQTEWIKMIRPMERWL